MISIKNIIKSWDDFWFSRFDPLNVSIYRISTGLLLFVMFIALYFNWDRFYGSNGVISLHDVDIVGKGVDNIWSIFHWTEGKIPIKFFWYLGFISSFAFAIGYQTRLATVILCVLIASMVHRNNLIVNGDDLVLRMLLFYSCFLPMNHCLSLDSYFKKKFRGINDNVLENERPLIWPARLIQINIALIYVISLPHKLVDDVAWVNGQAIYYTVTSNMWSMCPFPDLFYKWDYLLSKILTYGTILIEGTFPILVWFKETNLIVTILIAMLHIGIAFMVPNVTFFTLAMVCSFWVFLPSDTIRGIYNKYIVKCFVKKDKINLNENK